MQIEDCSEDEVEEVGEVKEENEEVNEAEDDHKEDEDEKLDPVLARERSDVQGQEWSDSEIEDEERDGEKVTQVWSDSEMEDEEEGNDGVKKLQEGSDSETEKKRDGGAREEKSAAKEEQSAGREEANKPPQTEGKFLTSIHSLLGNAIFLARCLSMSPSIEIFRHDPSVNWVSSFDNKVSNIGSEHFSGFCCASYFSVKQRRGQQILCFASFR